MVSQPEETAICRSLLDKCFSCIVYTVNLTFLEMNVARIWEPQLYSWILKDGSSPRIRSVSSATLKFLRNLLYIALAVQSVESNSCNSVRLGSSYKWTCRMYDLQIYICWPLCQNRTLRSYIGCMAYCRIYLANRFVWSCSASKCDQCLCNSPATLARNWFVAAFTKQISGLAYCSHIIFLVTHTPALVMNKIMQKVNSFVYHSLASDC